jgi:alpha-beta hydrolase superfamily lysophospholipase
VHHESSSDGTAFYVAETSAPVAALLFAHGYAESAARHEATLRYFAANGVAAYAYDLTGHGKSAGTRGFIRHFDELVEVSLALRARIHARHSGLPLFLAGYSLGGLVTVRSVETEPRGVAGCILISPGLGVARDVPPLVRRLGVAFGYVAPHVPVARLHLRALRAEGTVSTTAEGRRAARDPLIPARTAAELLRASHAAFGGARTWHASTLLVHGERDRVVPVRGPRRFASSVASRDFTLRVVANGHHDLLSGRDGDAIREEIVAWVRARAR